MNANNPTNPTNPTGKRALITGITGQDGSYLTDFLLSKGYEVHGLIRRASTFNTGRIDHLYQDPHESDVKLRLHYGDLANSEQLTNLIYNIRPDEIYHLGACLFRRIADPRVVRSKEYIGRVALGGLRN